jgi:hypothetical protein
VDRAAAAAAAGGDDVQADAQSLPLRSLALDTVGSKVRWRSNACGMRLLPCLAAACPQLTQLQLKGCFVAEGQQQQLATALTALRELRELSMEPPGLMAVPALELGSQLNKLRLTNVLLSAAGFRSLPPSTLVDLAYQPDAGFFSSALRPVGHLTALARLACYKLDAGSNAPSSVQQLQLTYCDNPGLLHALTRLQSLTCGMSCSLEQLQAAVVAIGPSLTALNVGVRLNSGFGPALLSWRVSGPSVPLTGLTVGLESTSVGHLGQWKGLTRLSLSRIGQTETAAAAAASLQQLAQQLQHLMALRELVLRMPYFDQPQVPVQPLVDAVVGMSTLRSLTCDPHWLDAQQRAQLRGMTQLAHLVV